MSGMDIQKVIGGACTEIPQRQCGKERIYVYTKKMVEKSSTSCQRGVEAKANIPVWKRYTLTITEAAEYYHIGETKLRNIVENHRNADFAILNGNRVLIKRQRFEDFLDKATTL